MFKKIKYNNSHGISSKFKIFAQILLATIGVIVFVYFSDYQLHDWGYTRGSFAAAMVEQVKADFDAADKVQAASAGFHPVTFSELPA